MNPGTIYLKVKLISLADEAKTIRRLERKMRGYVDYTKRVYESNKFRANRDAMWQAQNTVGGLYEHRIKDVASEARATNIALGLIKDRAYNQIENKIKVKNVFRQHGNPIDIEENKLYSIPKMWERVAKIAYKYSDGAARINIGFTSEYVYKKTKGLTGPELEKAKFEAFKELVFAWRDQHPDLRVQVKTNKFATA